MSHEQHCVAIVDDEQDITLSLSLALEDQGYRVVAINDAREAVDVLERSKPDAIVLDMLMPRMTGASLYSRLESHPVLGRAAVVILSGIAPSEEISSVIARSGGRVKYVEKPVDIAKVVGAIEAALAAPGEVSP